MSIYKKTYKNGNYLVSLDTKNSTQYGTKLYTCLRKNEEFLPEFPDSLDIKLTNQCYSGCLFCHESSSPDGLHGNLEELKTVLSFLPNNIPIELTFGGGNICLINPKELENFFQFIKNRGYQIGVTINSDSLYAFNSLPTTILSYIDNLGISIDISKYCEFDKSYFQNIQCFLEDSSRNFFGNQDIVIHSILGLFTSEELSTFLSTFRSSYLSNEKKLLILGYKYVGRGEDYFNKPKDNRSFEQIRKYLVNKVINYNSVVEKLGFFGWSIGFDNLAIEQLRLKDALTSEQWDKFYMGQDFSHSMYIDAVSKTFSPSSTLKHKAVKWEEYSLNPVKYFKENKNIHGK